jgi:DNA polymerase
LLGTRQGIGKLRGRFFDYQGIPLICTFHPAALLPGRSPERKKDVWEDMKKLLARMGRPIPGK